MLPQSIKGKIYEITSTILLGPFKFIADVVCTIYSSMSKEKQTRLVEEVLKPLIERTTTMLRIHIDYDTVELYLEICQSKSCNSCIMLGETADSIADKILAAAAEFLDVVDNIEQNGQTYIQEFREKLSQVIQSVNVNDLVANLKTNPTEAINKVYTDFTGLFTDANTLKNKLSSENGSFSALYALKNNIVNESSQQPNTSGGRKTKQRRSRRRKNTIRRKHRRSTGVSGSVPRRS